jgi:cell wall-associated NlpC family hydrolase
MTLLYDYALKLVGTPYRWGGVNPMEGFDCSGLVRHLLHSQGIATNTPGNARTLYEEFSHLPSSAQLGALVFYADSTGTVDHVALALNEHQHIEAAGGDHTTVNLARAIEQSAFVRVTPIRSNHVGVYMPEYPFRSTP